MIRLHNISKTYTNGEQLLTVLREISFTIDQHEFVSIMGPSGSGKSTLMNIIGCLDQASTGVYELEGKDITRNSEASLAQIRNERIGFVFQQFHLLPRATALANVELPLIYAGVSKKERQSRASQALQKVGLAERMQHMPSQLSGGQKQRVAIARAIVNRPVMILADEPTGALDMQSSEQIMGVFQALREEGTTVIVVTHEQEVAAYTHRTITIRDGTIITDRRTAS